MVDISATGASRTVVRKGTGLETPNYGSSCKGNDLLFSWIFFLPQRTDIIWASRPTLCMYWFCSKTESFSSRWKCNSRVRGEDSNRWRWVSLLLLILEYILSINRNASLALHLDLKIILSLLLKIIKSAVRLQSFFGPTPKCWFWILIWGWGSGVCLRSTAL